MPAYDRKAACKLFCMAGGQGCLARLAGKAGNQGWQARLPGKDAGQGGRSRLHAMVQYAESMVKLDNNVFYCAGAVTGESKTRLKITSVLTRVCVKNLQ
jgi:hypothetical protein